jgi:DNA-binding transcriptional MerR regulator
MSRGGTGKDLHTTGEVAQILGIKEQRVKNYSDIEDYGIRPLHVGSGRGSRRLYSMDDVCRIAIAEELAKCGFTPNAIGKALGEIRASELQPDWHRDNYKAPSTPVLVYIQHQWLVMPRHEFAKKFKELLLEQRGYDVELPEYGKPDPKPPVAPGGIFILNFKATLEDMMRRLRPSKEKGNK